MFLDHPKEPYIVAEIGSNWQTIAQAVESVAKAKAVGADCVKFQLLNPADMYADGASGANLSTADLAVLAEKAKACGIDFACTAFSPEAVATVDPYVLWHKVASSDLTYSQLLKAIVATGKPCVLSTGASHQFDIHRAVEHFPKIEGEYGARQVVIMYCNAAYPARRVDLRLLDDFDTLAAETHALGYGFSDHTTDILGHPVYAAQNIGLLVLEKHMTAFPDLDTPDRPHSLTDAEFKDMVAAIRGREPVLGPSPEERDMLLRHKRRLVSKRVIGGDVLRFGDNYGAYRSRVDDSHGINALDWEVVEGKRAKFDLAAGRPIGPGDFY